MEALVTRRCSKRVPIPRVFEPISNDVEYFEQQRRRQSDLQKAAFKSCSTVIAQEPKAMRFTTASDAQLPGQCDPGQDVASARASQAVEAPWSALNDVKRKRSINNQLRASDDESSRLVAASKPALQAGEVFRVAPPEGEASESKAAELDVPVVAERAATGDSHGVGLGGNAAHTGGRAHTSGGVPLDQAASLEPGAAGHPQANAGAEESKGLPTLDHQDGHIGTARRRAIAAPSEKVHPRVAKRARARMRRPASRQTVQHPGAASSALPDAPSPLLPQRSASARHPPLAAASPLGLASDVIGVARGAPQAMTLRHTMNNAKIYDVDANQAQEVFSAHMCSGWICRVVLAVGTPIHARALAALNNLLIDSGTKGGMLRTDRHAGAEGTLLLPPEMEIWVIVAVGVAHTLSVLEAAEPVWQYSGRSGLALLELTPQQMLALLSGDATTQLPQTCVVCCVQPDRSQQEDPTSDTPRSDFGLFDSQPLVMGAGCVQEEHSLSFMGAIPILGALTAVPDSGTGNRSTMLSRLRERWLYRCAMWAQVSPALRHLMHVGAYTGVGECRQRKARYDALVRFELDWQAHLLGVSPLEDADMPPNVAWALVRDQAPHPSGLAVASANLAGTVVLWQSRIDANDQVAPPYVILAPHALAIPIVSGRTYYLRAGTIAVGPTRPTPSTSTESAAMAFYGPTSDLLRLHADLSARPPHFEALVAHAALVKARDSNVGMKAANVSQILHELADASLCRASGGWLAKELQDSVMQLGDEQQMHDLQVFLHQARAC